jgi:RES domain-containing protein
MLYRYEIAPDRVLDLTHDEVRAGLGLGSDVLTGPDWTACQELGLGRLEPQLVEEWGSADQLDG